MELMLRELASDVMNIKDAIIRIEDRVTDVEEIASATSWTVKGLQAQFLGTMMDGQTTMVPSASNVGKLFSSDVSFSGAKQNDKRLRELEHSITRFNARLSSWERDTEMLRHLVKDSDKERTLKTYIKDLSKMRATSYTGDPIGIKTSHSLQKAFDAENRVERLQHENKQLRLQLTGNNSLLHAFSSRPKIVPNTGSVIMDAMKRYGDSSSIDKSGNKAPSKATSQTGSKIKGSSPTISEEPPKQNNKKQPTRSSSSTERRGRAVGSSGRQTPKSSPQRRRVSSYSADTQMWKPSRSSSSRKVPFSESVSRRSPVTSSTHSVSSWRSSPSLVPHETDRTEQIDLTTEHVDLTEQIDLHGTSSDDDSERSFQELSASASFIR
eukprot:TRINITY_DN34498_c0_g1_i1.p1 TRINITY_DN34498_c0_g1~~TRINITY_DN34498_c0_g1_i1.p1  ORF type:complete len:399 (+),score=73.47 TRINITY_DN34498_c0_g1_i1:57-1199(+)